jgi:uncharacterized DUF497 family protein
MGILTSNQDIPMSDLEKSEKINFIKAKKFEDFKIHRYYEKQGYPKHGIEIEEIKKVFYQFDKIIDVFKRPANFGGYKYGFIYKLNEYNSFVICFFLDENPPKFFNAYQDYRNIEKRIKRKYLGVSK